MDKRILKDYIDACAVIRETEAEIRKLEKKRKHVEDKVTGSNPEWPYEPRSFSMRGTVETVADANRLNFEKHILETQKKDAEAMKEQVEEWMKNIPFRMQRIIRMLGEEFIQGLTVLGGEPFEPENQPEVAKLMRRVKEEYPEKDIWCYSGYLYDADMQKGGKVYTDVTEDMLSCIDVLVDGEFVEELKDITLLFRGSKNQRLIKLKNGRDVGRYE